MCVLSRACIPQARFLTITVFNRLVEYTARSACPRQLGRFPRDPFLRRQRQRKFKNSDYFFVCTSTIYPPKSPPTAHHMRQTRARGAWSCQPNPKSKPTAKTPNYPAAQKRSRKSCLRFEQYPPRADGSPSVSSPANRSPSSMRSSPRSAKSTSPKPSPKSPSSKPWLSITGFAAAL